MSENPQHPPADAPASDLAAWWHRVRCAPCRSERREVLRLRRLLAGMPSPSPSQSLRERLHAEFQSRYGAGRRASPPALGAWERLAGGRRGWVWAGSALLLASLPALAGEVVADAAAEGLPCLLAEAAVGLVLAGVVLVVARGTSSRGASVAAAAVGAVVADAALGLSCPGWFASSHVLAFHVTGVALAIIIAGALRPRRLTV
ncbi:MAG: hypothetical protein ACYTG2_15000 [Planctomycetota bacterium]|jgi:hypothetical protein